MASDSTPPPPSSGGGLKYAIVGVLLVGGAAAIFAARGWACFDPNYRGSTGFGQAALQALLGHVGQMDVEDCLDAIRQAGKTVSTSKVVTYGSSHGGSLSAYLAPTEAVHAAVIINGALNLALNLFSTDDPSWAYSEVYSAAMPAVCTPEALQRFYEQSPLAQAEKVTVPVLLVAGGNDKCVSPQSSVGYYRTLKALGRDVKMLYYERDGHSISSRPSSYDFAVNGLLWMEEKLVN